MATATAAFVDHAPFAAAPPARPRVAISRCLLGDAVRYNGAALAAERTAWVAALDAYVDWAPLCPEVEQGWGVPRPPVAIVRTQGYDRLERRGDGADLTAEFAAYGATTAADYAAVCDGALLKARSPSCGVGSTPVVDDAGAEVNHGDGMFARALRVADPDLARIDEAGLDDDAARECWLVRIFAVARLRAALAADECDADAGGDNDAPRSAALTVFHRQQTPLLLEIAGPAAEADLRAILECGDRAAYATGFRAALATMPDRWSAKATAIRDLAPFPDALTGAPA